MAKPLLTQEYVKAVLDYDPETGILVWKNRPVEHFKTQWSWKVWSSQYPGREIKRTNDSGYVIVCIDYRHYRAHRLAWLIMTGAWPENQIDHKDGNRSNNKFDNLRDATSIQNHYNSVIPSRSKSGIKGVNFVPRLKRWVAKIKCEKKSIHLGYFNDKESARDAVENARLKHHGEFARNS